MPNPTVTHSTNVVTPDNPFYPVGSNEWNAAHIVTGLENVDNTSDATKNSASVALTNKSLVSSQQFIASTPPELLTTAASFLQSSVGLDPSVPGFSGPLGFASVVDADTDTNMGLIGYKATNPNFCASIVFGRTRSLNSTPAIAVQPGDSIGGIWTMAATGTNWFSPCGMNFMVDPSGTVTPGGPVSGYINFWTNGGNSVLTFDDPGNVLMGNNTAFPANSTAGFFYVRACAGPPTGVPSRSWLGAVPMVVDTSTGTGKLWVRIGSTWRGVALA